MIPLMLLITSIFPIDDCADLITRMTSVKSLHEATELLIESGPLVTADHKEFAIQVLLVRAFGAKREIESTMAERSELLEYLNGLR